MSWIIRNNETGMYVANPGHRKSHVRYANNARRFDTKEAAELECCGNDTAVKHTPTIYPWSYPRGSGG